MRTNIIIDDALMAQALGISGFKTKKETVEEALKFFEDLLSFVEVVGGGTELALEAIRSGFSDFEDALQSVCAKQFEADFIVTRNVKDYKLSSIKAISPSDFTGRFLAE